MTGIGPRAFWHDAFAWRGSVGPRVIRLLPAFGGFAALVSFVNYVTPATIDFGLDIIPLERLTVPP